MNKLCACGNEARYIDDRGAFTCAICPLKEGRDSIRLSDVPALLAWCREQRRLSSNISADRWIALAEIIGALSLPDKQKIFGS